MPVRKQFRKIAFLTPRPGLSLDAFYSYWRGTHGPTVANSPGYAAYRTRYAQNHKITDGPVGNPFPYPGIAEFHIPGDGSNEEAFAQTSIYRDRIRVDELNFIDMNNTVSMTAVEDVRRVGRGKAKLMIICSRASGVSRDEFDAWLTGAYAEAILKTSKCFSGKLKGWTLNHVVEGSFRLPGARPVETGAVDCVQELRFDSASEMAEAYASPGYRALIEPLWRRILSDGHTFSFLAEEVVFFDQGRSLVGRQ
ncbi:MAG: EthD domain-containing protein [Proteobacteria bacterium]|nr:EthD domain-containing protein [Pseudomonadota bacterium]MBI3496089.1 EthD domain-containing protein [Pseudomonadota bacterium]